LKIAECSGKMLEFSHQYGSRAHRNQRSGLSPQSIPHLQAVDELLTRSEKLKDSLLRIREIIQLQQRATMKDQMKDASEANASCVDRTEDTRKVANGEGKKCRVVSV
jgi:hypothetical protein